MYKKLMIILMGVLLLSACGSTEGENTEASSTTAQITTTTTQETTTTAQTTVAESEPEKNIWEVKYYVDKFGDVDPDNSYIGSDFIEGTFSNSATTDSPLKVQMLFDGINNGTLSFILYEYGENKVVNSYSSKHYYDVTYKYEDGEQIAYIGIMDESSDRIILSEQGRKFLVNHLYKGEIVKVYIEDSERPICNYLFALDGTGFKEAYKEFEGEE